MFQTALLSLILPIYGQTSCRINGGNQRRTHGMKALILAAEGFEDLEVHMMWYRLLEDGIQVYIASPSGMVVTGLHGYRIDPDLALREINPNEFEMLVLPGGAASERLRQREEALDLARTFLEEGKRVVAIGRGAQILISAGAINNRRVTCAEAIRDDVKAAGASYCDEPVVVDNNLVTCAHAEDMPCLFRTIMPLLTVA
jgi:protease I